MHDGITLKDEWTYTREGNVVHLNAVGFGFGTRTFNVEGDKLVTTPGDVVGNHKDMTTRLVFTKVEK